MHRSQLWSADAGGTGQLVESASLPSTRGGVLEKLLSADPNSRYPTCVAGERTCPPEDCGTPGYRELIDTLADPGHSEHEDTVRWLGNDTSSEFDPTRFDLADANRWLDAVVRGAFGTT
jgi:Plasmid pRiA4b ORF-3-like protein